MGHSGADCRPSDRRLKVESRVWPTGRAHLGWKGLTIHERLTVEPAPSEGKGEALALGGRGTSSTSSGWQWPEAEGRCQAGRAALRPCVSVEEEC